MKSTVVLSEPIKTTIVFNGISIKDVVLDVLKKHGIEAYMLDDIAQDIEDDFLVRLKVKQGDL